jgi:hypothetical protein
LRAGLISREINKLDKKKYTKETGIVRQCWVSPNNRNTVRLKNKKSGNLEKDELLF